MLEPIPNHPWQNGLPLSLANLFEHSLVRPTWYCTCFQHELVFILGFSVPIGRFVSCFSHRAMLKFGFILENRLLCQIHPIIFHADLSSIQFLCFHSSTSLRMSPVCNLSIHRISHPYQCVQVYNTTQFTTSSSHTFNLR